jgi:chromosomal replication initiator protein
MGHSIDLDDGWADRMAIARQDRMETPLRAALAERVGESRFGLWFGEGVSLGVSGDALEVGVPNVFFREWIEGHFARNLVDAAKDVTGRQLRLAFHLDGEAPPQLGNVVDPVPMPGDRPSASPVPVTDRPKARAKAKSIATPAPLPSPAPGRPSRRLDDFVTGPCNRLAFAAAQEMAANLGAGFNPLVIQGGVGLGKTHLLEGIAAAFRASRPGLRVIQTTAESFTNGFLEAMRTGTLNSFRSRYRGAGALILDDVHFLTAKRATQDEFLHTFNALMSEGAPIVLATDQHPRQIAKLTDELVTRFLGGMVVRLDAPDPATRKAILKAKARARGVDVPESVLSYVADHLRASVRELEGALHSLIAHATLTGKRLDLALAKTALRDTIRHTARAVGLRDVEKSVTSLFQVSADDLRSEGRARAISYPRMLGMYLARKHVGASYSEIGRFFGGRNHSTVISAEKKVKSWLLEESRIALLDGFETTGEILASLERSLGA